MGESDCIVVQVCNSFSGPCAATIASKRACKGVAPSEGSPSANRRRIWRRRRLVNAVAAWNTVARASSGGGCVRFSGATGTAGALPFARRGREGIPEPCEHLAAECRVAVGRARDAEAAQAGAPPHDEARSGETRKVSRHEIEAHSKGLRQLGGGGLPSAQQMRQKTQAGLARNRAQHANNHLVHLTALQRACIVEQLCNLLLHRPRALPERRRARMVTWRLCGSGAPCLVEQVCNLLFTPQLLALQR